MKLLRLEVSGLNKRVDLSFDFHDDVNVLTGVNGSGKTSLLKLMWYLVSGNMNQLRNEVTFSKCFLDTSLYSVRLERSGPDVHFDFKAKDDLIEASGSFNRSEYDSEGDPFADGEDMLRDLVRDMDAGSVYFPTFRRIEGGYSILAKKGLSFIRRTPNNESSLSDQMQQLSTKLSWGRHRFVSAISTEDISALVTERYAQISEGVNKNYAEFGRSILTKISGWQSSAANADESAKLLLSIQSSTREIEAYRENSFRAISSLSQLVTRMFSFEGVKLRNLALGDAAQAIDSELLSAGEKQMLSFLVFNAFSVDCPIFIDEPELSLHPDWQRRLIPELMNQQASNQFVLSTHSPFIYSKFSDKEIRIGVSRGDDNA